MTWLDRFRAAPPVADVSPVQPVPGRKAAHGIAVRPAPLPAPSPLPTGIAIAAIFKNEASYLREWLEFHLLVGVTRFYLYDNGSTDEAAALLAPYIASGAVRVTRWTGFAPPLSAQRLAYAHAASNADSDIGWLAFLDCDEFLFAPGQPDLTVALDHLATYDNVPAPRFEFGSNGHATRPAGLVIESYVSRSLSVANQVKSLVRPWAVTVAGTHRSASPGPIADIARDEPVLRVNHYFTKSDAEFEAKLSRGYNWRGSDRAARKQLKSQSLSTESVEDLDILFLLDGLRARLNG